MTQFLEGLGHSLRFQVAQNMEKRGQSILEKAEQFMNSKNFSTCFENQILYVLMKSEHFTPNFSYLQYLGILVIRHHRLELHFDLYILDTDGDYIKAKSTHQKTGLSKFCDTISCNSTTSNLMSDPYSSKFKLNFKYTIQQPYGNYVIDKQIEDAFHELAKHQNLIKNSLEFLELVPQPYNEHFTQVQKRMQRCRYRLFGCSHHYIPSRYEQNHKKHLVEEKNPQATYSWLWETQSRLFLSCLQEKIKKQLINSSAKSRDSNLADLSIIKPQKRVYQKLDLMLGSDSEFSINQGERVSEEVTLSSREPIKLDFILETNYRKSQQLEKIECLSQKSYYKFIRKYVNLVNFDLPSNSNSTFIVQKDQNLTLLNDYVQSSRQWISLQTKLRLCWQIVSVGYITLLSIKRFSPNFGLQNIYVANDLSIKLGLVTHQRHKPSSIQIAQICYFILYNFRCSANNFKQQNGQLKNREWHKIIKSVDDGESQYQGVSIINFWLKKVLLDAINNQQGMRKKIKRSKMRMQDQNYSRINTEESSQEQIEEAPPISSELKFLEKLLYVVSLAYQTYSEVFLRHTPQIFDRHVQI